MKARLTPARIQRHLRWIVIAVAALGLLYLGKRFEVVTLPEEGCSPLFAYPPGTGLLVDKRFGDLNEGDAVFFRVQAGALQIGRIRGIEQDSKGDPAYSILGDDERCPIPDSSSLGTFPRDRVAARVILAMPF